MFGKTRRRHAYYVCAPRKDYTPEGHPTGGAFFVREDQLVDSLNDFLSQHVFGAYRRSLLDSSAAALDADARRDHDDHVAALRRAITETDQRIKRTIRSLELVDDPTPTSCATSTSAAPSSAPTGSNSNPSSTRPRPASTPRPTPT